MVPTATAPELDAVGSPTLASVFYMSAFLVILVPVFLALFAMQMERLEAAVLRQPEAEETGETTTA